MKQLIHIDIPNEKGEVSCFEKEGGFFSALGALFAVWRYGRGEIMIGDFQEESEELKAEKLRIEQMVS